MKGSDEYHQTSPQILLVVPIHLVEKHWSRTLQYISMCSSKICISLLEKSARVEKIIVLFIFTPQHKAQNMPSGAKNVICILRNVGMEKETWNYYKYAMTSSFDRKYITLSLLVMKIIWVNNFKLCCLITDPAINDCASEITSYCVLDHKAEQILPAQGWLELSENYQVKCEIECWTVHKKLIA